MALGSETYLLLHRMLEAADTEEGLEIARKSFQAVVDENRGSTSRDDRFDVAWSMSCLAGIYVRLELITLAEQAYLTAIRLFDENDMAAQSAWLSVVLAKLYVGLGRVDDAESQMKTYVGYETRDWGTGSDHAMGAEEELVHFQKTGEIIQAFEHRWCKPCGVDEYGVGFDD
jgi:ATP/maltotriose-dependent transcriptional regulator MalT